MNSSQLGLLHLGSANLGHINEWVSMPLSDLELLRAELLGVIAQTADQLRAEFSLADIAVEAQANAYTDAAVGSLTGTTGPSWILPSFTGAAQQLELFESEDGITWTQVSGVDFNPGSTVRDPSIIRVEGRWHIVYTNDTAKCFSLTSSDDLRKWTSDQFVNVRGDIPGIHHVWAPEWFRDPNDDSLHVLFATTVNTNIVDFQIYEKHPLGGMLSPWSVARKLVVTGEPNVIDPFLVWKNGTYYLWYKSQNTMVIQYASSSTLYGPYTNVRTGDWAGWGSLQEGPSVVKMDDRWRVYGDDYQNTFNLGQLWYSDSFDDWATWTPKHSITTPSQAKHGTVIRT